MSERMDGKTGLVSDIMTTAVVSVRPDTPLADASKIIAEHHFDGVPVVHPDDTLAGILTEYDLVSKGSALHLPTVQRILGEFKVYKKDRDDFQDDVDVLKKLSVRDLMNDDPLTLLKTASLGEVVKAFRDHHRVNPIPVIDAERKVVGVVSRFDVMKLLGFVGGPS